MAFFRRSGRGRNLGTVSIGDSSKPIKVDNNDPAVQKRIEEIENDTQKKIEKYRKENPEPPSSVTRLDEPLKIKRSILSLDSEYVELAKRYLGLPPESKPTVVELSKSIIKLFEDNAKLYKEIDAMRKRFSGGIKSAPSHSWEHSATWN